MSSTDFAAFMQVNPNSWPFTTPYSGGDLSALSASEPAENYDYSVPITPAHRQDTLFSDPFPSTHGIPSISTRFHDPPTLRPSDVSPTDYGYSHAASMYSDYSSSAYLFSSSIPPSTVPHDQAEYPGLMTGASQCATSEHTEHNLCWPDSVISSSDSINRIRTSNTASSLPPDAVYGSSQDAQAWMSPGPGNPPHVDPRAWSAAAAQAPYGLWNAVTSTTASSQTTASPAPASTRSSPSSASGHPTFTCLIDQCGVDIPVDISTLKAHLGLFHGYPALRRGQALECRWSGCICKRTGCKGRNPEHLERHDHGHHSHGVHGEDIVGHIWEQHLNFQDPCPKCGEARWSYGFSKTRHEKACPGRKQARCRRCCVLFESEAALAGDVELRLCARGAQ